LHKAGIQQIAKITASKENEALFKKYGAGLNTLVICSPDGEKLKVFAGEACTQSNVSSFCKSFPEAFAAWLRTKKKS